MYTESAPLTAEVQLPNGLTVAFVFIDMLFFALVKGAAVPEDAEAATVAALAHEGVAGLVAHGETHILNAGDFGAEYYGQHIGEYVVYYDTEF